MSSFLPFLIVLVAVITFFSLVGGSNSQPPPTPRVTERNPDRISSSSTYSQPAPSNRQPSRARRIPRKVAPTSVRSPRRVGDREYMRFRNCPECHSENELNNQVIFQRGPHQFYCSVCNSTFNF